MRLSDITLKLAHMRVGVRGYDLSLGHKPSPGSHRTMLRIAEAIRPLPMEEVAELESSNSYGIHNLNSTSATVGIDGAAPIRCTQTEAAMLA